MNASRVFLGIVLMFAVVLPSTVGGPVNIQTTSSSRVTHTSPETPQSTPANAEGQLKQVGQGIARAMGWSPNSEMLAIGSSLGMGLFTRDLKPVVLFHTDDEITALAWNPDGRQIATASRDRSVQLWDVSGGKPQTLFSQPSSDAQLMGSVSYNSDGTLLASANAHSRVVQIWDTATGQLVATLNAGNPVTAVAWRPHSSQLALGGYHSLTVKSRKTGATADVETAFIQIWDVTSHTVVRELQPDPNNPRLIYDARYDQPFLPPVASLQWYDTTQRLLINSPSTQKPYWGWVIATQDIVTIEIFAACGSGFPGPVSFSPDGVNVAAAERVTGCGGESPFWMDVMVDSLDEASDEAAANAGPDTIRVQATDFGGDVTSVQAIVWAPDNRTLAVVRGDGTVTVNYIASASEIISRIFTSGVTDVYKEQPFDVDWGTDPNQTAGEQPVAADMALAVENQRTDGDCCDVHTIKIRNVLNGQVVYQVGAGRNEGDYFISPSLSPDHESLVAGFPNQSLAASTRMLNGFNYDPSDAIQLEIPPKIKADLQEWSPPDFYAWSPDASRIATVWDGFLLIWDASDGKILTTVENMPFAIPSPSKQMQWSPDSQTLLFAFDYYGNGIQAVLIEGGTHQTLLTLNADDGSIEASTVQDVRWEPGSQHFAIVDGKNLVHLWNVASHRQFGAVQGFTVEWSPIGKHLAVASDTHTVMIYDSTAAHLETTIQGVSGDILAIAFSPDGKRLATAESNGLLQVWETASGKLLTTLSGHRGAVLWAKWKPDGSQILSRGADGTLRLWSSQ